MIKIEHLVKNYGSNCALDDVSFDAYSGEILGIAGISGCGQKELLEAIAGLQSLNAGSILYHDPKTGITEELRESGS